MSEPRYHAKYRFKLAVQRQTKLVYTRTKDTYRDTMQENSFLPMLPDCGYQAGEMAKLYYPQGVEVAHTKQGAALAQKQSYCSKMRR